jgi:transposase
MVAGIDDWAFRRNHRNRSIVCDLERRLVVALLPDREMATVEAWLSNHPEVRILSRDRGGGYGEATAKAKDLDKVAGGILRRQQRRRISAPGLCGALLNLRLGDAFKRETGFDDR